MEMDNHSSQEAETRIQKFWEQEKVFKFDEN